jgi:predicted TIM-barrel fold metal-dependent hydrolase
MRGRPRTCKRPTVQVIQLAGAVCRRVDGKRPAAPPADEAWGVDLRVDGERPEERNPAADWGVGRCGPADQAVRLQVQTNDRIAELVNAHPDRFQGFATLAMPAPAAAANELERAVTTLGLNGALLFGRTGERNLDHAENWPIFEAAASLRAPLYIHPQIPQPRVRAALYAGFDDAIDNAFATFGIGWHYETGVRFLRLALAGVFDRFPDLQVLLGHWGEVVLFFLERADGLALQAKLPQSFSEYVRRNAYITAGGVYSRRYLRWAVEIVGAERVLFATDYPYRPGPDGGVEHLLQTAGLDQADQERIAAGNWDALVAGIRR